MDEDNSPRSTVPREPRPGWQWLRFRSGGSCSPEMRKSSRLPQTVSLPHQSTRLRGRLQESHRRRHGELEEPVSELRRFRFRRAGCVRVPAGRPHPSVSRVRKSQAGRFGATVRRLVERFAASDRRAWQRQPRDEVRFAAQLPGRCVPRPVRYTSQSPITCGRT